MKVIKYRQYTYLPLLFLLTGLLYLSNSITIKWFVLLLVANVTPALIEGFCQIILSCYNPNKYKNYKMYIGFKSIDMQKISLFSTKLACYMTPMGFILFPTSVLTELWIDKGLVVRICVAIEMFILILGYIDYIYWINFKYKEIKIDIKEN
ncbi:hypothetical protein ACWCL1_06500 [Ligilactobacillus sp. LYQ135]